jgi:hypothetical protein
MGTSRSGREDSGFSRKFITWAIVIVVIVCAVREPHQAAAIVHAVAVAVAKWTNH